jgi:glycopeptide antibiotics resistance protein
VYGAIALGLTVFCGLFILDTAVVIRYFGIMKHTSGHNLTLDFSRLFQESGQRPVETFSNFAVFVPFGLCLAEFLADALAVSSAGPKSTAKRLGAWRRIGRVALASLGLSLCIECLQLALHVGFFELTDLVLNTVGGGFGAWVSMGVRKVVGERIVR